MAISDEQYLNWLQTQNVFRCILVEFNYLEAGVQKTGYASNLPFVSYPTDSPASVPYDDVLTGEISYRRSVRDTFDGGANVSRGEVVMLLTPDTQNLISAWFNIQSINIFLGAETWQKNDFRKIVSGVIKNKQLSRDKIVLSISDDSEILNKPFSRSIVASGVSQGKESPLCFGNCFNVSPLLVDSSLSKYKVHDGAIEDITQVRDNGVAVAFTKNIADGTFTLTSSAAGQITADVKGAKPASGTVTGYKNTPVEIVRLIISNYSDYSASLIDSASFADLGALANYECGLYIQNDKYEMIEAIDSLLKSIGAFWYINRLGAFIVGRIDFPTAGLKNLFEDEIKDFGINIKRVIDPRYSTRLGYRKNWTEQKSGLAGSVSEANKTIYGQNYSLSIAQDASVLVNYPDAKVGEETETLLISKTDCDAEALRRLNLAKTPRTVYEIESLTAAYSFEVNDSIVIQYSKLGFENGVPLKVLGISESIGYGTSVIEAFA